MELPVEIEIYVLEFISLNELVPLNLVCTKWKELIDYLIINSKINDLKFKSLARLIGINHPIIPKLCPKLSSKLWKQLVCLFVEVPGY